MRHGKWYKSSCDQNYLIKNKKKYLTKCLEYNYQQRLSWLPPLRSTSTNPNNRRMSTRFNTTFSQALNRRTQLRVVVQSCLACPHARTSVKTKTTAKAEAKATAQIPPPTPLTLTGQTRLRSRSSTMLGLAKISPNLHRLTMSWLPMPCLKLSWT